MTSKSRFQIDSDVCGPANDNLEKSTLVYKHATSLGGGFNVMVHNELYYMRQELPRNSCGIEEFDDFKEDTVQGLKSHLRDFPQKMKIVHVDKSI